MIELPLPLTAHLRRDWGVSRTRQRSRARLTAARRAGPHSLEFVKDTVALVQVAETWAKMLVYVNGLHGPRLHVHVP